MTKKALNVLIACEESQAICKAFRALGQNAYSADLQPCSGGRPEWHIQGDALQVLNPEHGFFCQDDLYRTVPAWDLVIAHPPCTFLTAAGAVRLYNRNHEIKDFGRYKKGEEAAAFFMQFYNAPCDHIVIENPVPLKCFGLPAYSQIIEPWQYGDPWKKRTCLWFKNMPQLVPDKVVEPLGLWVGSTCARRDPNLKQRYKLNSNRNPKIRSKTFPGIARAIAEQYTNYLLKGQDND